VIWPDPVSLDAPLDEAVREELARDLVEQGRIAIPMLLGLLLVLGRILGMALVQNAMAMGCYLALLTVVVLRWAHALMAREGRWPWPSSRARMWSFAAGALLMGTGLAVLSLLVYTRLNSSQVALLALVHLAILSVGILSMAASPTAFVCYSAPILSVLAFILFRDGRSWGNWDLLALVGFYALGLGFLILRQFRSHREALTLSIQNSRAAIGDSLTGLRNRRYLQAFMETEVEQTLRAAQEGGPFEGFALLMIDLDHFKEVNDHHGHANGDAVLRQVSRVLKETARKADVLVRWGGEEFVVVARLQEREGAGPLALRFLEQIRHGHYRLLDGEELPLTCTLGYTVFPFFPERPALVNWERALALADAAMLRSKVEGRNRMAGVAPRPLNGRSLQASLDLLKDLEGAESSGLVQIVR
jgi:diguanylate cyclase (GGDEF)-like protein